ncbi:MAG TPA: MBL fold metallo-hydrolase [Vicinamibacterales bacterium]|nr:MBL fold metallo-hydrolase [Vicinamibacterales bacterium]
MNRRDFLARAAGLAGTLPLRLRARPSAHGPTPLGSRLILLGTAGGPTPKTTRAYPGQIIVVGDRGYVIDCGNGIARQLQLAGVFRAVRHIFITHHHSDHNADLGNLILLRWGDDLTTPIDAWGPPPLTRMMTLFFEMNAEDLNVRQADEDRPALPPLVHTHELSHAGGVMKDDRVTVTCAIVPHPLIPIALAYRFDCPDRSIVISGDTHQSAATIALARGADVLVHEALYVPAAPGAPGTPLRRHIMDSHTAVEDAARVAAAAGVKTLVLSHLVPGETTAVSDEQWLAAARPYFSGRIVVGRDLMEM